MKRTIIAIMLTLAMAGSVWGLDKNITVGGKSRNMRVHIPANMPEGAPLVIACHGMNQDANWHDTNSKWTAVADTAKFALVFPNAINKVWDISGSGDTDFILAIIDHMSQEYKINTNRVYMTGFSMGGMLTYHCANRISDRIAAFCPVSGYPMGEKVANSSRPVPIMHFHGTGDDVCVYSGVQPTLDVWIARNKCNASPKIERPYPANNRNVNTTHKAWTDGLDGMEVHLIAFDDKGHWQSEDPAFAVTSVEAWRFMQRWSLGPDAPKVTFVTPEDGSFDLPQSDLKIVVTFDQKVSVSNAVGTLILNGAVTKLNVSSSGREVTLNVPSGVTLKKGSYTLSLTGVKGENGATVSPIKCTYIIGVEEVGEVISTETVFAPNLRDEQNTVGEGIPTGWYRLHSTPGGDQDEKGSGSAATGAARMKYFPTGGDFSEGFYLSARNFSRCDISYGRYDGQRLHLQQGNYTLTCNSVYWNEGSLNASSTFDISITNLNGDPIANFPSLASSGNQAENSSVLISGSTLHSKEFSIPEEGDYLLTISMTQGWNAVIVGNFKITSAASAAQRYKGTFQRKMAEAKSLIQHFNGVNLTHPAITNLRTVVERYEGFVSTSPTAYTKAITELTDAINAVTPLSTLNDIKEGNTIITTEYFDLTGRPLPSPATGLTLIRQTLNDGSIKTIKNFK